MLKIKDNVDLKELEKFGFKKRNHNGPCYIKNLSNSEYTYGFILIHEELKGTVVKNAREICCVKINSQFQVNEFNELLSTLYDLIKDDLVERVWKNR